MSVKFYIRLRDQDFRLLRKLADLEYREPRQQAGLLIREALERRLQSNEPAKAEHEEVHDGRHV